MWISGSLRSRIGFSRLRVTKRRGSSDFRCLGNVESVTYALSTWAVGSIPLTTQVSGWPREALFRLCLVSIFDVSEPTIGKFFSDSRAFGNAERVSNVLCKASAISFRIETPDFPYGNRHLWCIEVRITGAVPLAPKFWPWRQTGVPSRKAHQSPCSFATRFRAFCRCCFCLA